MIFYELWRCQFQNFTRNFSIVLLLIIGLYSYSISINTMKSVKPLILQESAPPSHPQNDPLEQKTACLKFMKTIHKQHLNYLNDNLLRYYGQNYPIEYQQKYNFEEQWEDKKNPSEKEFYHYFKLNGKLGMGFQIAKMVVFAVTIWVSTVEFFIQEEGKMDVSTEIYALTMFIEAAEIIAQILNSESRQDSGINLQRIIKKSFQPGFCLLYLALKLASLQSKRHYGWAVLQIFFVYLLFKRAGKTFQSLRFTHFTLRYEYQAKIVDLILKIFVYTHFAALIFFMVSRSNPHNNWMSSLDIAPHDYLSKYIYSYYFCTTTIMTVGYGDLSPKNTTEIVFVIFIQVFGVMLFAYIVNQIGYSISALRKNREVIEKDLSVLQKMRRHYKMQKSITNKISEYIVNDTSAANHLTPEQQNNISLKLNEELRQQMKNSNNLSVIKSSIFFLCRWSKCMQKAASLKLQHIMLNPKNIVSQPMGKQRIYIIKNGAIDIFAERNGRKRGLNNLLKTIQCNVDKQVSDNCYGYTAVISAKVLKMYALARQFTSAYYLSKDKFMEAISQNIKDFEYYHQLKDRINFSPCCQSFQAPLIESSRHHYYPNKRSVLRKSLRNSRNNKRQTYIRHNRSIQFRGASKRYNDIKVIYQMMSNDSLSESDEVWMGSEEFGSLNNIRNTTDMVNERKRKTVSIKTLDDFIRANQLMESVCVSFEVSKNYSNYYPKSNMDCKLNKYENTQFCYAKMVSAKGPKRARTKIPSKIKTKQL